jgi:hypothetical protein
MDGKGYATHVLPLMASHFRDNMVFMQDSSFVHTLDNTLRDMALLGLELILWLANSPDLNPIKTIWFQIK